MGGARGHRGRGPARDSVAARPGLEHALPGMVAGRRFAADGRAVLRAAIGVLGWDRAGTRMEIEERGGGHGSGWWTGARSRTRDQRNRRERTLMSLDPREQTLASFDWQWANLPAGDFMPGDPWFDANATRIVEEMTGIRAQWFEGKTVLDAGCGLGRWSLAMLRMGARVTAVDYSEEGLARTAALCAEESFSLETLRVDLLNPPAELVARRFDLVFSYGVLHHTGDTWTALDN